MNLWAEWQALWEITVFEFNELWQTNWPAVQFRHPDFIFLAAAFLGAAFLLNLGHRFDRKKRQRPMGFYASSGYRLDKADQPGWPAKLVRHSFKIFLFFGGVAVITALADPFTTQTGSTDVRESREVVYLKDASTSMGWRFKNYEQSRAEIVQDFQLNLVAQRRGKFDRAAFVLFETRARIMAEFTRDADSLLFSIDNAPLVIANPEAPVTYGPRFVLKKGFRPEPNSGATNLHLGLEAVIKLFELKGNKEIKDRSVIIITDGAAEQDPEPQLRELKKRKIIPYLVFIDPDTELEKRYWGGNSDKLKLPGELLKQVRRYGGDYFIATDKNSLKKISGKLDQLHAVKFTQKSYSKENFIYRRFLVAGLWLMALAGAWRLITWAYQWVT